MGNSLLSLLLLTIPTLIDATPITPRAAAGTGKRGVAFEQSNVLPFFGLSWGYDWNRCQVETMRPGTFEYVPMFKSEEFMAEFYAKFPNAKEPNGLGKNVKNMLTFNEPDQCGGGGVCIQNIALAVAKFKEHVQPIADANPNVRISAPAVTNGVEDPDTKAPMGKPYITEFMRLATDQKLRIDFMVAHWYDVWPANEARRSGILLSFAKQMRDIYEAGGGDQGRRKLWITEFGINKENKQHPFDYPSYADQASFLERVMPWLDAQDWIERYSYQYAHPGLLMNDANSLSPAGQKYISYVKKVDPSHTI